MSDQPSIGSAEWRAWRRAVDLDDYERRFDRIAADGGNPHGEVDFVMQFAPLDALDAGCGFGRVGIELHRRGVEVVGVDLDPDLIERARRRAPDLDWRIDDLTTMDLGRTFSLVVAAGNVIGYVDPARRREAVVACARHVAPGGHLVMGNQLTRGWPTVDEQRRWAADAGFAEIRVFAGWDGTPFDGGDYAVVVFSRPRG